MMRVIDYSLNKQIYLQFLSTNVHCKNMLLLVLYFEASCFLQSQSKSHLSVNSALSRERSLSPRRSLLESVSPELQRKISSTPAQTTLWSALPRYDNLSQSETVTHINDTSKVFNDAIAESCVYYTVVKTPLREPAILTPELHHHYFQQSLECIRQYKQCYMIHPYILNHPSSFRT